MSDEIQRNWDRRRFVKRAALFLGAALGPWSLYPRAAMAKKKKGQVPAFLTKSEYKYINRMAREIIPAEPVLSGKVDVAGNIDRFFDERNYNPDFLVILRFLRLIRMADGVLPMIKSVSRPTYKDIMDFKRTICFLGYYSDLNGEAELPPEERIVWPSIGYGGPKGEDWWPPGEEAQLDRSALVDRVEEELG